MSELEILQRAMSDIADVLGEYESGERSASYVIGYIEAVACRAFSDCGNTFLPRAVTQ